MKRKALGRVVVSSLIIATTMVGCSGAAFRPNVAGVKQQQKPQKLALMAEKALAAQDGARAVSLAEAAVRAAPDSAAYRALLGRAYIAAGRFASAQAALTDATSLGDTSARTVIGLALVHVAQGRAETAQSLLATHRETIPAADYGLAVAMAGDAPEGVRALTEAVQTASDARTRQNLAYAYALAGRWKDARMMAGQDLAPLSANQRISQWAQMADPAMAPQRVAALMGTTVAADDAGQPVALALAPAAPEQVAGAPLPQYAEAAASAAPASFEPTPAGIETAPVAPMIPAPATPVRVAAPSTARDFVEAGEGRRASRRAAKGTFAPAASAAWMQQAAYLRPVAHGASNWVVQLGAYDGAAIAKEKWAGMARGNVTLAAFPVLTSEATVKGRNFHRLAVTGFATRADALSLCRTIQSKRGQCFVRESAPNATLQRWAGSTAKGRQYASR